MYGGEATERDARERNGGSVDGKQGATKRREMEGKGRKGKEKDRSEIDS